MLTYEGIGSSDWIKACANRRFLGNFVEHLAKPFFAPFDSYKYPVPPAVTFYQKNPPCETITLTATDGVQSAMQKWSPSSASNKGMPILLVPGASVDYKIFALPTIAKNFVDYLLERGYVVYCVTHRVGNTPVAKEGWTTYDARHDIAAATKYILQETGASKIYSVVHCAGAQAMAAGLLDGTIEGIGGLTASQVFMHPIFAKVNKIKAGIEPSMPALYNKLVGPWYDVISGDDRDFMLNQVLRFYPEGGMQDVCRSIVCHRSELAFGRSIFLIVNLLISRLWSHENLNEATHENLASFIGGVSIKNLEQLMYMGYHGHIVDNNFRTLLTHENIDRLHGIPIFFIHGGQNSVYSPVSTVRDYDLLLNTMDGQKSLYKRSTFSDKGHLDCWMGHGSYKDVYVQVEEHARTTILEHGLKGRV